jgi:hypothetical protein
MSSSLVHGCQLSKQYSFLLMHLRPLHYDTQKVSIPTPTVCPARGCARLCSAVNALATRRHLSSRRSANMCRVPQRTGEPNSLRLKYRTAQRQHANERKRRMYPQNRWHLIDTCCASAYAPHSTEIEVPTAAARALHFTGLPPPQQGPGATASKLARAPEKGG